LNIDYEDKMSNTRRGFLAALTALPLPAFLSRGLIGKNVLQPEPSPFKFRIGQRVIGAPGMGSDIYGARPRDDPARTGIITARKEWDRGDSGPCLISYWVLTPMLAKERASDPNQKSWSISYYESALAED
jgi:hypothetical protein